MCEAGICFKIFFSAFQQPGVLWLEASTITLIRVDESFRFPRFHIILLLFYL